MKDGSNIGVNRMNGGEYFLLLFLLWPVFAMAYYLTCFKYRTDDSLSRNSLNSSNHKTEAVTIKSDDVDVTVDIHEVTSNPLSLPSQEVDGKQAMKEKNSKGVKNIKV